MARAVAQNLRNLVYFPNGPDNIESDLAALAASPFVSNVVLGQFHFGKTDGALSWNTTDITQVSSSVWTAVRSLSTGSHPKVVSLQIGSAGNGMWRIAALELCQRLGWRGPLGLPLSRFELG